MLQKADDSQGLGPFLDSDEDVRKKRLKSVREFLTVLTMLVLTTVLNSFLAEFIQPSSLVFVYLVPTIAGAILFWKLGFNIFIYQRFFDI